jgi:phosphatidylserine decarboxylase
LSAVAARQVFLIKANNTKIGRIGIIFIGMAEVSSCVPIVKKGDKITKGQQLGYFMFGGSSHAVIF